MYLHSSWSLYFSERGNVPTVFSPWLKSWRTGQLNTDVKDEETVSLIELCASDHNQMHSFTQSCVIRTYNHISFCRPVFSQVRPGTCRWGCRGVNVECILNVSMYSQFSPPAILCIQTICVDSRVHNNTKNWSLKARPVNKYLVSSAALSRPLSCFVRNSSSRHFMKYRFDFLLKMLQTSHGRTINAIIYTCTGGVRT